MADTTVVEGVESPTPDPTIEPKPTIKYVKPKFKRGGVVLPVKVKIPYAIAAEAGISRFLWLEKDKAIPQVALKWLMTDARYSGWFTKKQ